MTGATIDRVIAALLAGRAPRAVAGRLTIAAGAAAILWASASAFLLMEPLP